MKNSDQEFDEREREILKKTKLISEIFNQLPSELGPLWVAICTIVWIIVITFGITMILLIIRLGINLFC